MKRRLLVALQEKISKFSKKPWACFETEGPNEDGRLAFSISFNDAFIKNLHALGYQGMTDEQTVQMFFLSTKMIPESELNNIDTVNPSEMPNLSSEANTYIKR